MTNNRTAWTNWLNGFNNANASWSNFDRAWLVNATTFAIAGIEREGFFTVKALGAGSYHLTRTRKARS